jgi:hypothetical protein
MYKFESEKEYYNKKLIMIIKYFINRITETVFECFRTRYSNFNKINFFRIMKKVF